MKKAEEEIFLEAGFKKTTVQEWLDLSDADMEVIEIRLRLSRLLKKQRKLKKLTQAQAATIVNTDQPRLARIEKADKTASIEAMLTSLYALGAKKKDISKVFAE